MHSVKSVIAANYARIRDEIEGAAQRAGRPPSEVSLVAVTKSAQIPWIEALLALGVRDLGESRPQQLVERAALFGETVRWHLIGHLQRNKVRKVLPAVAWIHSVDTVDLLQQIGDVSQELGLRPRLLLEVNVSGEASKNGFRPEPLRAAWPSVVALSNVEVAGLMTMAPLAEEPEAARPVFAALREFRDELAARSSQLALPELSMGMSGDFQVAVEEGATTVRIGTSLFEGLPA
jgi:PLP dependent protein